MKKMIVGVADIRKGKKLQDLYDERNIYADIYYSIYRFYHNILTIPKELYWFYQRGKRGYADCDVWDFDSYLRSIIIPGLKSLKKRAHGEPSKKEYDIMIRGFESNQKMEDLRYDIHNKKYIIAKINFHKGMQLFSQYFNHLWD